MNRFQKLLKDPFWALDVLLRKCSKIIKDDESFIRLEYFLGMKKRLRLDPPVSYNEKIQWLKLNGYRHEYVRMVDKYEAKFFASDIIGQEHIIPTIGIYDSFDQIDFDALPSQFVIKTTHDSGGVVVCKDKTHFDLGKARRIITKSLKRNFYWEHREPMYKDIIPRVIVEEYMEDQSGELKDYKFFCFNGEVKALFVASDRFTPGAETKFDFFDADYNHLPFTNGHPNAAVIPPRPLCFEQMKAIARKLSAGIPHVRVDLYDIDGMVFFGEMTFYHWSGIVPFKPDEWDYTFGEWLVL